jgi:hypothetical protein
MFTRRIVTSVCALCLASPAAAVAAPGTSPPSAKGRNGIAPVTGPPLAKAKGPYGATPITAAPAAAQARGPYGVTPTGPPLAKAKGPYGATPITGAVAATAAAGTSHPAAGARNASPTAWRVVAIGEAALLAALALAAMALVAGRRRTPHMVT